MKIDNNSSLNSANYTEIVCIKSWKFRRTFAEKLSGEAEGRERMRGNSRYCRSEMSTCFIYFVGFERKKYADDIEQNCQILSFPHGEGVLCHLLSYKDKLVVVVPLLLNLVLQRQSLFNFAMEITRSINIKPNLKSNTIQISFSSTLRCIVW